MFHDRYGLALSTHSASAADYYTRAVDETLAGNAGAEALFEQAIAADDGFAMAHIGRASMQQMRGHHPSTAHWQAVRDYAADAFAKPANDFAALHCAIAFAASKDQARLSALLDSFRARNATWMVTLCEAMLASASGDYAAAATKFSAIEADLVRLGGSRAQRDMVEATMLEAYLRSGDMAHAQALIAARHERPPLLILPSSAY